MHCKKLVLVYAFERSKGEPVIRDGGGGLLNMQAVLQKLTVGFDIDLGSGFHWGKTTVPFCFYWPRELNWPEIQS